MKLNITKESLIKPLRLADRMVAKGVSTNEVFSMVHMEVVDSKFGMRGGDGTMEAFSALNLDGGNEDSSTMLSGEKLLAFCETLGDGPEDTGTEIQFSTDGEHVAVVAGRRRMKLKAQSGDYPRLDVSDSDDAVLVEMDIPVSALATLIEKTSFLIPRDAGHRPALQGMLLELRENKLRGVATDAQCLVLCDVPAPAYKAAERTQFIIPRLALDKMGALLKEAATDATAQLRLGTGTVTLMVGTEHMSSKLIDAPFPDYARVLDKAFDKEMVLSRYELDKAMDRANTVFDRSHLGAPGCVFTMKDSTLNLYSKNSNGEEVEEDIDIERKGDDITLMLNTDFVKRSTQIFGEEKLQFFFTEPKEGVQVMGASGNSDILYMMMPMSA